MHIDGWRIEGFGVFHEHQVRGLGPGLTVFLGPNEAGKSTLLAFIRGVLVGYPARHADEHFPPLRGGEHGGRVFLRGPEGEVSVERMVRAKGGPRLVFPDRSDAGDDAVRRLLGGVDAGLFNSVFAFSLDELRDLGGLSDEGVRDRIFSAGIAGAGRSARQAAARLDKEALELVRPRKGGSAGELMEALKDAEARVEEARVAAARYPEILRAEADATARVAAAQAGIRSRREDLRRRQALLELWPTFYEGEEARRELESLGPAGSLPADPEGSLAEVTAAVAAAAARVTGLEEEAEDAAGRLQTARAAVRDGLDDLRPRVESLADSAGAYQAAVGALPQAGADAARARESLARLLSALGRGWDEARLGVVDVSLPRTEEVRRWRDRLLEASAAVADRRRERDAARGLLAQATEEHGRLRARLEAEGHGDAEGSAQAERLRQEEAALRRLRAAVAEERALRAEIAALQGLASDRERSVRGAEAPSAGGARTAARSMGVLAVVAALVAVVAALLGEPMVGGVVGAAAAVLAAAAYGVSRSTARTPASEREELQRALDSVRRELADREAKAASVAERVRAEAGVLGLGARPALDEVDEREALTAALRERVRAAEGLRERLAEAQGSVERATGQAAQAEDAHERTVGEERALEQEWSEWVEVLGVPRDLGPDGAVEFLRTAREARDAVAERDAAVERVARLEREAEEWEGQARALVVEAGGSRPGAEAGSGLELVHAVRRLREACVADGSARAACAEMDERLRALSVKLESARQEQALADLARAELFERSGAGDEEEYRALVELGRRRRSLEDVVTNTRRAVESRLGQGPEAQESLRELARGRVDAWAADVARLEQEVVDLEREATEAIREHRDAERARQVLEGSSDVAACELELEGIRTELDTALRRWRVVIVARQLIKDTLAEYSRSRQPPVLKEASEHLARVTRGAYVQIVERHDADGFEVVDSCGGVKTPEKLSRGTLEQLYLSLRLGLVAEFSRRVGAVPVIMDDVLVNFDPERSRATAEVLASFAEDHQVLFFTCHPATVELLQKVDGRVSVIELGPGSRQTSFFVS